MQGGWFLLIINDLTFALDIGTRTVIGVVGKMSNGKFDIIASEIVEHKSRAMMDGQVHDIDKVAEAVIEVKDSLEQRLGIKLHRAAIAAAGRVLRTKQVHVDANIEGTKNINEEDISNLELEGIQLAQYQLDEELINEEKVLYYCVGYSVVNYYLNSYVISNLLGHKGKKIGADIIATFLPNTVVDSLYSVMRRAKLEVSNLTLEPIAAINVAIPKDLRLLNLALVDIGAGTSDIAITREGTIVGFGMVPVAGDEITEAICHNYIVDFNTAERIKTSKVEDNEEIAFTDILGNNKKITRHELIEAINPSIEYLADTIAAKILEFNKKPPQAVFLVGGGSQIKNLDKLIANKLNILEERVAVRKSEIIQNVTINDSNLDGPDAITPIGIALTSITQPGYGFINVRVNGSRIRLFNSRELHIADAILLAGFKPAELIGKNGRSLKYEVNGAHKTVLGGLGKPAEITINGAAANLQTRIFDNDDIVVKAAEDGVPAKLRVFEVLGSYENDCDIYFNGDMIYEDCEIQDGDKIEIIEVKERASAYKSLEDSKLLPEKEVSKANEITVNVNGDLVKLSGKKDNYIFVDIFDFYDFDLKILRGKLITKLNDTNVSFSEPLKDGDKVEIYWV